MIAHVLPRGDRVQHEITDDCVCVPCMLPEKAEGGQVDWIVVHHALDGRP